MPLAKQLKKVKNEESALQTHGIGAKRVMGIIDGRLRSFLEYNTTGSTPRYRFVLDENMIGSAWSNYHSSYDVDLVADGEVFALTKDGLAPAYPMCGADNGCTTQMTSYYRIENSAFDRIERMPENALLEVRIRQKDVHYRPCRDFIAAAEFKLLKSAIEQGID